jgi:hypothetical protein
MEPVIVLSIIIAVIFLILTKILAAPRTVRPDTSLQITYLGESGEHMEKYRLGWVLSDSTFVEKREVHLGLDGATPSKFGPDLPSSAAFLDVEVPTDASVIFFTKVFGDNGTVASSEPFTFIAVNGETVAPDSGLTASWLQHIP